MGVPSAGLLRLGAGPLLCGPLGPGVGDSRHGRALAGELGHAASRMAGRVLERTEVARSYA
jgi:hypothetical protein